MKRGWHWAGSGTDPGATAVSSRVTTMLQGLGPREARHSARELKFLLTPKLWVEVLDWARAALDPDPYASGPFGDEYRTTSLYFDNEDLDVYHRRGSFGRCKYRIRRYGSEPVVFLERKVRTDDMLTKRRTTVGLDGLCHLNGAAPESGWPGHWFRQRLNVRRLRPTCQVSYQRVARVGMSPYGPMRLTFDREISAHHVTSLEFIQEEGKGILGNEVVLEMKFRVEPPVLFRQLTERFALEPRRISKYRLSLEALTATAVPESPPEASEAMRSTS